MSLKSAVLVVCISAHQTRISLQTIAGQSNTRQKTATENFNTGSPKCENQKGAASRHRLQAWEKRVELLK